MAEAKTIPDRYLERWRAVAGEANRRRIEVGVFVPEGVEPEDDGVVLRGPFNLVLKSRSGIERRIGQAATFDDAIRSVRSAVELEPLPGPDQLREELRAFARRLAILTPRDVAKKSGADVPIYRIFRDRIIPLAWDNLVDSVRLEALEDFVRRVGTADQAESAAELDRRLPEIAAEARGLVAPKEPKDDVAEPEPSEEAPDVQPARPRRRRTKKEPTDAG